MFRAMLLCLLSVVVLATLGTWLVLFIDGSADHDGVRKPDVGASVARPKPARKAFGRQRRARPRASAPAVPTGILAEEKRYSKSNAELVIRDFFEDRNGGFFVDVGCGLPIAGSNSYYLEKHLGWKGIGVDTGAHYESAWLAKRPRSKLAVRRLAARSKTGGYIPTTTLTDLIDRQGVAKIDLLLIRGEVQALKALSGLDIHRFQPQLVVISGRKRSDIRWMREHRYRMIKRYLPYDRRNRYFEPMPRSAARENP